VLFFPVLIFKILRYCLKLYPPDLNLHLQVSHCDMTFKCNVGGLPELCHLHLQGQASQLNIHLQYGWLYRWPVLALSQMCDAHMQKIKRVHHHFL